VEARFYNVSDAIDVSGWRNIVAISASATHVVGVTADGRVLAAGWNAKGQSEVDGWVLFTPEPTPSPMPEQTPKP
jgi:alpha-tubulin suppressor-like RCC1 family protein